MYNLKISETFKTLLSMLCSALSPFFASLIKTYVNTEDEMINAFIMLSGYIVAIIIFILLHSFLPRILPFCRPFYKYEGHWLQIIPKLEERPFSIITFTYNPKFNGYHLSGMNYSSDLTPKINFDANKFVETNSKNGFYYITNITSENKNGLGKISFINGNYDHLTRAEGYFFDSSNENISKKYDTYLIKCDKKYLGNLNSSFRKISHKKIPPADIIKISETFLKNELENIGFHDAPFNDCHQPENKSRAKKLINIKIKFWR